MAWYVPRAGNLLVFSSAAIDSSCVDTKSYPLYIRRDIQGRVRPYVQTQMKEHVWQYGNVLTLTFLAIHVRQLLARQELLPI